MALDRTSYRQIPARAVNKWYVGLDVGQSIDPTAFAALQHVVTPGEEWDRNDAKQIWRQQKTEKFLVRYIERLPLQTPYPQQIEHVTQLLERDPLRGAAFALDYTGCGRPVADMFLRAGLKPQCVLITAGNEVTRHNGDTWHVPKNYLISSLESRLHSGELKFAPSLAESDALKNELRDFARHVSETGRVTFNARSGAHDDLILAICIAVFIASNRYESSSEELWKLRRA
jgi:hypothetical protein